MLAIALVALVGGGSYTFGGFDADETQFLKHGAEDLVCAPPAAGCRAVDKKTARTFTKPARTRKIVASVEDDTKIKLADGERTLGEWSPGTKVLAVNTNVFVSPGGGLVAVEYDAEGKAGKVSDVVVFDVSQPQAPPVAPKAEGKAPTSPGGPPPPPATGDKTAYQRALGQGGVWEQRLQPCDQAGVHLELKKTRRFDIRITTKCQGHKDDTELAGAWTSEGADTLVLSFENEEGPLERLDCRFAQCGDVPEECLTCAQEDVTFTMQVVRRK